MYFFIQYPFSIVKYGWWGYYSRNVDNGPGLLCFSPKEMASGCAVQSVNHTENDVLLNFTFLLFRALVMGLVLIITVTYWLFYGVRILDKTIADNGGVQYQVSWVHLQFIVVFLGYAACSIVGTELQKLCCDIQDIVMSKSLNRRMFLYIVHQPLNLLSILNFYCGFQAFEPYQNTLSVLHCSIIHSWFVIKLTEQ